MGRENVEEPGAAVTPPGPLWPAGTALLLGQPNAATAAASYLRHTDTTILQL